MNRHLNRLTNFIEIRHISRHSRALSSHNRTVFATNKNFLNFPIMATHSSDAFAMALPSLLTEAGLTVSS